MNDQGKVADDDDDDGLKMMMIDILRLPCAHGGLSGPSDLQR